jgi:hypothetical protein
MRTGGPRSGTSSVAGSNVAPTPHASASITQAVYAHEFENVKRADRTRERMEAAYGEMLG